MWHIFKSIDTFLAESIIFKIIPKNYSHHLYQFYYNYKICKLIHTYKYLKVSNIRLFMHVHACVHIVTRTKHTYIYTKMLWYPTDMKFLPSNITVHSLEFNPFLDIPPSDRSNFIRIPDLMIWNMIYSTAL